MRLRSGRTQGTDTGFRLALLQFAPLQRSGFLRRLSKQKRTPSSLSPTSPSLIEHLLSRNRQEHARARWPTYPPRTPGPLPLSVARLTPLGHTARLDRASSLLLPLYQSAVCRCLSPKPECAWPEPSPGNATVKAEPHQSTPMSSMASAARVTSPWTESRTIAASSASMLGTGKGKRKEGVVVSKDLGGANAAKPSRRD
jgi:hypothetical protein